MSNSVSTYWKDKRFRRTPLPFEGRSVAILWNGDADDNANADEIVNDSNVIA
jgi:hypothetical protein